LLPRLDLFNVLAACLLATLVLIAGVLAANITQSSPHSLGDEPGLTVEPSYIVLPQAVTFSALHEKHFDDFTAGSWQQVPWQFGTQQYWLRLTITNNQAKPRSLVARFDNPMVDNLLVYHLDEAGQVQHSAQLGDHRRNLSQLEYALPHYAFTLQAQQQHTLVIGIHTTGISKTPVNLYSEQTFFELSRSTFSLWSVYVGVLLMTALYNLILYFSIRDRVYLLYVGYILAVMTLLGIVLGYGFYLWPTSWQQWFHHQVILFNYAIAITTLGFCVMFLRYHKDRGKPYRVAISYLQLLLFLCALSLFLPEFYSAPIFFMTMPGLYIICFWLIFKKLISGFRWAKYYVLSWFPLLCAAAIQPLELTGVIEYSYLTRHAFLFGSLIEITLMALALADRVRYQRKKSLYYAIHNSHSGLLTYTTLMRRIAQLQNQRRSFTLCIVHMANFQNLQKTIGIESSSQLLKSIAATLSEHAKALCCYRIHPSSKETVAELNNGCLAVLSAEPAATLEHQRLPHLLSQLQAELSVADLRLKPSYILATVAAEQSSQPFKQLIEQACQRVQKAPAGRHRIFSVDDNSDVSQLQRATALQQAMHNNELCLYYQPQLNLQTLQVCGAEALLRWPQQQSRDFTVEDIIHLAEQTGLINQLTLWILNCACRDIAAQGVLWQGQHISVNLSARDIHIADFTHKLADILNEHGVAPTQLKLELTESALVDDPEALKALIARLAELGVKVVLDDYGTGYSSLEYLVKYAFAELKIDKYFVMSLAHSQHHQAIVNTTIMMAHNLGLKVTAEGVETQEIAHLLRHYGADTAQGYLYAKPMNIADYNAWLQQQKQWSNDSLA
tara:strand:+ start:43336 stop:45858 length:2523 start_codon:yes stop_codon:yes gene_type:complete